MSNKPPKATVLVVDDDPRIRDAIVDILDFADANTLVAINGRDGIDTYLANQEQIDLIILDLCMPVMGGEEALVQLMQINPDVRVLVSSGYGQAQTVRRLVGQGAVGFLHKPYDLHTLLAAVEEQLTTLSQPIAA